MVLVGQGRLEVGLVVGEAGLAGGQELLRVRRRHQDGQLIACRDQYLVAAGCAHRARAASI